MKKSVSSQILSATIFLLPNFKLKNLSFVKSQEKKSVYTDKTSVSGRSVISQASDAQTF